MRPDTVAVLFMFLGIPWTLGWILRTVLSHQRFMKVTQLKAEANARLVDRFGSEPGLFEHLKNDAQQQVLDVTAAEPRMPVPYMRMLTSIQISFLLVAAGWACLFTRQYMRGNDQIGFLFFGTLGVALGVGALLSAVAAFAVARLWTESRA